MTFRDILTKFRETSFTQKDKGTRFERIIRDWFKTDPRYNQLTDVWLWEDFPSRKEFGGSDTGIDLVAKTEMGEYWAIQCKCYSETTTIDKPAVDSFLATSGRTFTDPDTFQRVRFSQRIWVSTTPKWGTNAEEAIQNQEIPVSRVNLYDLDNSPVDWEKLYNAQSGNAARASGNQPFDYQLDAVSAAHKHYEELGNVRGKLIMACGTGKTFTSLRLVESILGDKGLVLFLVPSIALLGQSLNAWAADAKKPIKAVCICSDAKASRKFKNTFDDNEDTVVDLALPASTNIRSIARQLKKFKDYDGLTVVFSTYQSIDVVQAAQAETLRETDGSFGVFDFIICDEAHRTTGVILSNKDESSFTKIHKDDFIRGRRRLYMTATPRLYGESAKIKASQKDCILCSMDDEETYGQEFYRINFSTAVQKGRLTDYKVLVLTVNEQDIPASLLKDVKDESRKELNFDDTSKLIGVINGLSKVIRGDGGSTWEADPRMMRRAVAFCSKIGTTTEPGTSKNVASVLPSISEKYAESLTDEERQHVVSVDARHVDGSMNSAERNEILAWLKEETENPNECRVVTNVRCLSEGVDVPALDAVLFLSARNSQVDVVQSVGRVMRNFRKGSPDEKRYGYIIIPIVVPEDVAPEDALNDNTIFSVVWSILNALRSHDDHFNAEVNKIALNKQQSKKVVVGGPGLGKSAIGDSQTEQDAKQLDNDEVGKQLTLRFGELQDGIYAKLVEKCGDRLYWENWAKEIGIIARKIIERITRLVRDNETHKKEFEDFVKSLRKNLNPSIKEAEAIEMLAQHMISRPVFDALFADYRFVDNNTVSRSMQHMIDLLEDEAIEKDTAVLDKFYESVRVNVGDIDNLEGKQTIIKNLYEKFFKGAFPLTVEKLGIVYTPVECVDFIIYSVNEVLKKEFKTTLTEENVHILDPFTGTGTFITRLLQSGLIKPEDMERKYLHEIHCNEIILLAYYIADVNIESVFHDLVKRDTYLPYDGICLTDTFQLAENPDAPALFTEFFQDNNERVERQKRAPIRVILGNPPYSVGQKSANDNAQNQSYPILDKRIADTYAANTSATNKNSLYDSYIKAFRWASDRLAQFPDGGVVAFISNGAWIDGNAQDGMRQCLESEFSAIYVLNLRGNARTQGELRRKEGGGVFDAGSRTPIAITILVKNPAHKAPAVIHYLDIGDYLTREKKLSLLKDFHSISSRKLDWQIIEPNDKHDWINQRDGLFDTLIPLGDKDDKTHKQTWFVPFYSNGLKTQRDPWCYNSSEEKLKDSIRVSIDFYNQQREDLTSGNISEVNRETSLLSWTRAVLNDVQKNKTYSFEDTEFRQALYRPFFKQNLCFYRPLNEMTYQIPRLFPTENANNMVISIMGSGGNKQFTCLITNNIPDVQLHFNGQCFPLYYYEENKNPQGNLFSDLAESEDKYIRRDGITDWVLKEVRSRFSGAKSITKEDIFYYVYGILHSPDYRERFADDLRKSLPRIPIVEKATDFVAFSKAGRALADLHLNYDQFGDNEFTVAHGHIVSDIPVGIIPRSEQLVAEYGVHLQYTRATAVWEPSTESPEKYAADWEKAIYEKYAIPDKMRFAKVRNTEGKLVEDKSTIIYNGHITISNIPAKAYEYVVNGKSAIEWIMERYAVTQDQASGIINNCNDWAREHGQPRYILDVLLSIINVSCKTVDIVNGLPKLTF